MQRCVRYKRVRSRFGGTVRRCAKYRGRSSNGRRRGYRRRRSGMARRGSHCKRYKRVPSVYGGTVRRCADFSRGRRRSRKRRGGYRKGHRPFNKGRRCLMKKRVYSPRLRRYVTRCASYGGGETRFMRAFTRTYGEAVVPRSRRLGPGGPSVGEHYRSGTRGFQERTGFFFGKRPGPG